MKESIIHELLFADHFALAAVIVVVEQVLRDLGRVGVGRMGKEWRTVGHCDILEGMSERVGRVWGWKG